VDTIIWRGVQQVLAALTVQRTATAAELAPLVPGMDRTRISLVLGELYAARHIERQPGTGSASGRWVWLAPQQRELVRHMSDSDGE
jgi:DNA-binding MarR family transcriptional regulator